MKEDNVVISIDLKTRNSKGELLKKAATLNPNKTAIVVVDMWGYHWCKTWMGRAGAMVCGFNKILSAARGLGMTVVHAPTNFVNAYVGYPQREKAAGIKDYIAPCSCDLKKLPLDDNLEPIRKDIPSLLKWPGDMCGSPYRCMPNYGGYDLDETLIIDIQDYICANGQELYNICMENELDTLIYIGGASNMCLLIKPESLLNMTNTGLNCIVAEDLVEAYSAGADSNELDLHTKEATAYIQQYICPSFNFIEALYNAEALDELIATSRVLICPWGLEKYPQVFDDKIVVTMSTPHLKDVTIHYTLDGTIPNETSPLYNKEIVLDRSCTLKTIAIKNGEVVSMLSESYYVKLVAKPALPCIYLSDITPSWATLKGYVPWWSSKEKKSKNPPSKDCSYDGTKLTIRGVSYDKGVGVDSPSQLVYNIKDEYDTFVASAGVCESLLELDLGTDDAAFPEVIFKVFIDGALHAESIKMHISDEPWRFCVKIPKNSKKLSLVTMVTTAGLSCNNASWLNAGFILNKI